jgi:hypothetical protein
MLAMIVDEVSVEDVGEASFEGSSGFGGGLPFADLALVVEPSGAWVAGMAECDGVQGGVELPVAGGVEPVAAAFAAGGFQWCGSGVAGEVVGGRETGDVADVAEDLRGDDVSDTVDVGDGRVGLGENFFVARRV